jgi:hypothetical protein
MTYSASILTLNLSQPRQGKPNRLTCIKNRFWSAQFGGVAEAQKRFCFRFGTVTRTASYEASQMCTVEYVIKITNAPYIIVSSK